LLLNFYFNYKGMTMKFTKTAMATAMLLATMPVLAEEAAEAVQEYTFFDSVKAGAQMTNFRLRYENVDQDGNGVAPFAAKPLKDANAMTLRSLIGWQTAPFHNFSIGAQLINVTKLDDNFNDKSYNLNTFDAKGKAVVADPDYTGVNQLYIDWTGIRNTKVRLGRQSVKLDNVRFIGNVEYRQVMQVFDGVAVENKSIQDTEIYAAYFNRAKSINTDLRADNTGILHALYHISPSESLIGYAYLYDQEHVLIATDGSSKTFGVRLDGTHKLNDDWKALYTAEYAKQDDYQDSSKRTVAQGQVDAHYYKIGAGAGYGNLWARVDQELLSSNNGKYAFQTPLGTNHLFQGWVDKFLTTPNQGLQDTFVTAGYKYGDFTFLTEYHWYKADKDFAVVGGGTGDDFGHEWDASVMYTYNKNISAKLEYGTYSEGDLRSVASTGGAASATANRIRDTNKLWLTAMYTF
jgi:hypothetical protein